MRLGGIAGGHEGEDGHDGHSGADDQAAEKQLSIPNRAQQGRDIDVVCGSCRFPVESHNSNAPYTMRYSETIPVTKALKREPSRYECLAFLNHTGHTLAEDSTEQWISMVMAVRFVLIAAAVVLALAGCKHRTKSKGVHRAAPPAQVYVARQAQPRVHQTRVSGNRAGLFGRKTPQVHTQFADANATYRLDSGDRLRIVVFGQQNLSRTYAVDGGGYISMPLIGAVASRGATTFELEQRIADQLRVKYVKDPKVTVEVETYRPFFILGEVRRAGQFPYVNGMTVQTAVAIAGGFSERAKESEVQLTRRANGRAVTRSVPPNYPVRPGDTIKVTERFF
ncbi:MAG: polysaccharide biosynthesis/export family protein [Methyloligellaceae bacterium]